MPAQITSPIGSIGPIPKCWRGAFFLIFLATLPTIAQEINLNESTFPAVGTVLDEARNPVENIRVQSFGPEADRGSEMTDAAGRFEFTWHDPRRLTERMLLAKDADGHRQAWFGVTASRLPVPLELVLKPAHEVKVKVVDSNGDPYGGIKVVALGGAASFPVASALTGADGAATLRVPNDAVGYVMAVKPGAGLDYFTPQNLPGARQFKPLPDEITLTINGASRRLRVRAVDSAKEPVAGVRIGIRFLRKPGQPFEIALNNYEPLTALTDAAGVATFDWLPQDFVGVIPIDCQSSDRALLDPVQLTDNRTVELLALVFKKVKITGQVLLPSGQPAAGIQVRVGGFHFSGGAVTSVHTNSQGAYEIFVPSEQYYMLCIDDDRWAAQPHKGLIIREGAPDQHVDFKLIPGTLIKGTVTQGPSHRPYAKCPVELVMSAGDVPAELGNPAGTNRRIADMSFHRGFQTDENGNYQVRVGPGNWTLRIGNSSLTGQDSPEAIAVTDQPEIVKNMDYPDLNIIRFSGLVLDAAGAPMPRTTVTVHSLGKTPGSVVASPAQTDDAGRFVMERNAGSALLVARNAQMDTAIEHLDKDQTQATLRFRTLVKAQGKLVDGETEGVETGVIRYSSSAVIDPNQPGPRLQLVTGMTRPGPSGMFALSGLYPGETCEILYGATERSLRKLASIKPTDARILELGDLQVPEPATVRIDFKRVPNSSPLSSGRGAGGEGENRVAIYVNGELAAEDADVTDRLPQLPMNANRRVIISADKEVDAQTIFHVIQLLAQLGMRNVELPGQFADFDLVVRPAASENDQRPLSLPDALRDQLSKVEGVKQVVGCVIGLVQLGQNANFDLAQPEQNAVLLLGLPPDSPQLARLRILSGGRSLTPDDLDSAIIGRDLARKLDKKEGDELVLGAVKFKIIGVYFSRSALENNSIIVPLAISQRLSLNDGALRNRFNNVGFNDLRSLLLADAGPLTAFGIIADPSLDADGLKAVRKNLAAASPNIEVRTTKPRKAEAPAEEKNSPQ
jgi:hypothetical protein